MPSTDIPELSSEQAEIVNLPLESQCLVLGGAGTGKTLVLVHRLAKLMNSDRVGPGSEVLVLSFSRNAVKEIRSRLQALGGAVAYVRARTFDSFATRLLNLLVPPEQWIDKNYDERIRFATVHCGKAESQAELKRYKHVVVDELQDLVGDRAEFVKVLLESTNCGFTLLGDPAQGIYDFQLKDRAGEMDSVRFFKWLRGRFGRDLHEYVLLNNFRAKSAIAKAALWAGAELNSPNPDFQSIHDRLNRVVQSLPSLGDTEAAAMSLNHRSQAAILCRTNGQALTISGQLSSLAIKHVLQMGATDRIIARWVAIYMRKVETSKIGKSRFMKIAEETNEESAPEPLECWKMLKRAERGTGSDLEIDTLASRIRCADIPDDLIQNPVANVVTSTIHKAKGLEFDTVLITEPEAESDNAGDEDALDDLPEETRLLYVALTRAKLKLFHLNRPDTRMLRKHSFTNRWVLRGYKSWQTRAVEVRGEDIHHLDPAGTFVIRKEPIELQGYLREKIKAGDPVILNAKFQMDTDAGYMKTFYVVEHNGQSVGITNDGFGRDLNLILKRHRAWKVNWPVKITNLRVQAVDTVAGLRNESLMPGFGNGNIWLRVRVFGLGKLVFA